MRSEPDLEALRALVLVAEETSMSAASARLGVSQQAVSLRIRRLERDLRVPMLVRSARGSRLTPAGEAVVGWAATMLAAADEFADAVESLRAERGGTLRVASSLTIAEHLLPEWIARWRVARGEGEPVVRLTAANSAAVTSAVRDGAADLGFIEAPGSPAGLGSVTVARDTIEIVVRQGHPWASAGEISVRELASTPLVLRETGSGTRQAFEAALLRAGAPRSAEPAMVSPTTLGVRSAVMAGVGPGVLSSFAIAGDTRAGRLVRVRLAGLRITRPLQAIWAGSVLPPFARDLLDLIANS